jgi:hypothetical protein
MRLTLRTMLAFLDGILEPQDSEDIGKKVEDSEFATGLVHRIRDVMRRLRLGAPSLTDRGPGLDPNTVAEYLDNTLPGDRVTDFEKVCLESDVHLAEVASCHQILTLVLGEPAEIDPSSRQRMYQLQDLEAAGKPAGGEAARIAGAPPLPVAPSDATAPTMLNLTIGSSDGDSAGHRARLKPTVPEYLREQRPKRRWLPAAAALVLAACFTVVVLNAVGQLEPGTPLGDSLVRLGVMAARPEVARAPESPKGGAARPAVNEPAENLQPEKTLPEKLPPEKVAPEKAPAPSEQPKPAELAPGKPPQPGGPGPAETPVEEPVKKPVTSITIKPETSPQKTPAEPSKLPASQPRPEPAEKPAEPPPLPPEPLGRFMSIDQVLLRDAAGGDWQRVAPNQMLTPQRLLALPTYRAKVSLTIGVAVEILGGTQIELLGSGPQELPGVCVRRGRVVLMPLAKGGTRLRLVLGDRAGILTFTDPESVAAVEVRRIHAPGTNPETEPARVTAELYATSGNLLWDEGGGKESVQLTPPARLGFDAELTSAPVAVKELPKWIAAEPMGVLDRRASVAISQALQTDLPARLGLLELTDHRQKEVRWLALRCMGYIGQFHPMVVVLNDQALKPDWPEYIDQLREAVARDAESAAAVREALEKQYPQRAADLYRMLWGYTDKDLQGGEDFTLVKALDDENLPVRLLSFWNLKDITGLGLFYRPEQTAAMRRQPTTRWRQRLEAKEIRIKSAEEKAGAAAGENTAPLPPDAGT